MIESADEFVRLRTSEVLDEYRRAANEPAADGIWLDVIARYPDMRFWVAQNKKVPLEFLRILANDEDSRVRWMVACKRKLDRELFVELAGDPDEGVRLSIANNKKVPQDVLRRLAEDSCESVKEAALRRLIEIGDTQVPRLVRWWFEHEGLTDALADDAEDVEFELSDGTFRWCSFVTPGHLQRLLEHPMAEPGFWWPDMVVVKSLEWDVVDSMLRHLEAQGKLIRASRPMGA